jgi:hypothetical protein
MRDIDYQVIRFGDGWGIVLADRINGCFATQQDAFDAAIQIVRTLRTCGQPLKIRVKYPPADTDQVIARQGRQ